MPTPLTNANASESNIITDIVGNISHNDISDIGTNSHAQIDTHIADSTIHFTEGNIDHANILNVGTNTHAQIDTHIATSNIHRSLDQDLNTTNSVVFTGITAPSLDAGSAVSLTLGTTNASEVQLGKLGSNVVINGNLVVQGDSITHNVASVEIEDSMLHLGLGRTIDNKLTGFFGVEQANKHCGLIRDHNTNSFKLFSNITALPSEASIPVPNGELEVASIVLNGNDLQTELNGKASTSHTHTKAQITDFTHTHVKADITDFTHTHVKADITDFTHTHVKADITDFTHTHVKADITDLNLSNGVETLTSGEVNQIKNIDSNVITNTQWGYIAGMNQGVATSSNVSFGTLTCSDLECKDESIILNTGTTSAGVDCAIAFKRPYADYSLETPTIETTCTYLALDRYYSASFSNVNDYHNGWFIDFDTSLEVGGSPYGNVNIRKITDSNSSRQIYTETNLPVQITQATPCRLWKNNHVGFLYDNSAQKMSIGFMPQPDTTNVKLDNFTPIDISVSNISGVVNLNMSGNLTTGGTASITGNTTISGNLTVNGVSSLLQATDIEILDESLILNTGTTTAGKDCAIVFKRPYADYSLETPTVETTCTYLALDRYYSASFSNVNDYHNGWFIDFDTSLEVGGSPYGNVNIRKITDSNSSRQIYTETNLPVQITQATPCRLWKSTCTGLFYDNSAKTLNIGEIPHPDTVNVDLATHLVKIPVSCSSLVAPLIDTSTGVALEIGKTTATNLNLSRTGQTTTVKGGLTVDGSILFNTPYSVRTVASASDNILSTDDVVLVNYTATGTVSLTLPAISGLTNSKKIFKIIDGDGNASVNNITINRGSTDTIIGGTSIVINSNYNTLTLLCNGTVWYVI